MTHRMCGIALAGVGIALTIASDVRGACCYFAAKGKDVNQPGQKAFITFDAGRHEESFTVQPRFEGSATDFGMVIPTPARPKLDEMPRDFFGELAVFTILEPMDLTKYKQMRPLGGMGGAWGGGGGVAYDRMAVRRVKVLEAGIVGSLDYKIISADRADDLYAWLKENNYAYAGDQATLDHYVQKKWVFTTMKIDPKQMKPRDDGSFEGQITPTRFTFQSDAIVYPLKITQISVKQNTEALFYVQTTEKVDLPGPLSYQASFVPMWLQALSYAIPDKITAEETAWRENVERDRAKDVRQLRADRREQHEPATLEWAKKITAQDIEVLSGDRRFNREAPAEEIEKLKLLKGHVAAGQFVTKIRKVFARDEMGDDLVFVKAAVNGKPDPIQYYSILPTSPP